MHRDKTVARILLILSVVHVAAAAPATVRQRYLDVDQDVTPASEKRGNPSDTPYLHPVPQMDNDRPSASGTAQLENDPPPASGTAQLDNGRPSALGTPQLDNDTPPASGAPRLHDDSLTEISSVHDDLPLRPEPNLHYTPSLHDLEVPSLYESQSSSLGEPLTMDDIISTVKQNKLRYSVKIFVLSTAFSGFLYGLYKVSSHHFQRRDLTGSSDVVGRGVSTHPRPPRKLVSRAPANLLLLSVLTRRALERLD